MYGCMYVWKIYGGLDSACYLMKQWLVYVNTCSLTAEIQLHVVRLVAESSATHMLVTHRYG